jgi:hypothetical protein
VYYAGLWALSPASTAPPAPLVRALAVEPAQLVVGGAVLVSASIVSASGLTFAYVGLPDGCLSVNAPAFACVPSAAGNYTIGVLATSTTGRTAQATVMLSVLPTPTPPQNGPGTYVPPAGNTNSGSGPASAAMESLLLGAALGGVAVAVVAGALQRRRTALRRDGEEIVRRIEDPTAPRGPAP